MTKQANINFNAGLRTKSISMSYADYIKAESEAKQNVFTDEEIELGDLPAEEKKEAAAGGAEARDAAKAARLAKRQGGGKKDDVLQKINSEYKTLFEEIKENSNIQMIIQDKSDQDILDLLNELILDFKEQGNLKKIESLEKKLINNLDESAYSELIKLKSQLNRE